MPTFKERFNLRFNRSKVVRLVIYGNDRRLRERIVIPDSNGQVRLDGMLFIIDENSFFLKNGIPTYTYKSEDSTPLDMAVDMTSQTAMSSDLLAKTVDSAVYSSIINDHKKDNPPMMMLIMILIMVAGFGIIGYLMFEQMETLNQLLGGGAVE